MVAMLVWELVTGRDPSGWLGFWGDCRKRKSGLDETRFATGLVQRSAWRCRCQLLWNKQSVFFEVLSLCHPHLTCYPVAPNAVRVESRSSRGVPCQRRLTLCLWRARHALSVQCTSAEPRSV